MLVTSCLLTVPGSRSNIIYAYEAFEVDFLKEVCFSSEYTITVYAPSGFNDRASQNCVSTDQLPLCIVSILASNYESEWIVLPFA